MIRRNFLVKHSLKYDKDFEYAEDYDLWTRVAHIGKLANIPEPLLCHRVHENQISISKKQQQKRLTNICRIRMLLYLLDDVTDNDRYCSELLYQVREVDSTETLLQVINWLNRLLVANSLKKMYMESLFLEFIELKKERLVNAYYLHRSKYTPRVAFEFFTSPKIIRNSMEFSNVLRLMVKAFLFWSGRARADQGGHKPETA